MNQARNYDMREHHFDPASSAIKSRKDVEFLVTEATGDKDVKISYTANGLNVLAYYPWSMWAWLTLGRWRAQRALRTVLQHESTLLPRVLAKYLGVRKVTLRWRYL